MPKPGPGEALVRVEACGICASDLKCFHGAAKFWGDETRAAWAEREVTPATNSSAGSSNWMRRPPRAGASPSVTGWSPSRSCLLEMPLLPPRAVPDVRAARHLRIQAANPGGMAVHDLRPNALVHKISSDMPASRRLRRAAFLFTARGRAGRHWFRRRRRGRRLRADRARHGRRRGREEPRQGRRAGPRGAQTRIGEGMRCRPRRQCRRAGRDAEIKAITDGYGADVYIEGTGHPAAVAQGLDLLRKLGTFVEYCVFGAQATVDWSIISDDKELDIRGAHLGPHSWPAAVRDDRVRPVADDRICTHQLPVS